MSAIPTRLLTTLADIVGQNHVTTRREDLHCYSYDGSAALHLPDCVVFPERSAQVSEIMKLASHYAVPVVPRGAGTGMTGGVVPLRGGIVMAMTRMNRVIEIDTDNQIGIVEPGVVTGEFQRQARRVGLFYPPDPASLNSCSIGGNAAECAGGPSAVKYGVTKDYIIGLEVVLADGDIITTGARTEKSVSGYDLTRLFVGSEGTLGIITKLIVRLLPLPPHKETFLLTSTSLAKTTELVSHILNSRIKPCTLEYMDRSAIRVVSGFLAEPPPDDTEALLIIEIDGEHDAVLEQSARLRSLLENEPECALRQARDEAEVDDIWQARRAISPSTLTVRPAKINEDVAVPRSRIPHLVAFMESLSRELEVIIITFGHAGDGNIHVNIMLDRNDPDETARAEIARDRLFQKTIELDGTLSGEHGIGSSKAKYMTYEHNDATLALMKRIKRLLDPKNILNPGKIFPGEADPSPDSRSE